MFDIKLEPDKKRTENTVLKRSILRYLKKFDRDEIEVIKTWGNAVEKRGRPDMSILYKGITTYIELKDPRGELDAVQRATVLRYENIGVPIYVIDNLEDFKKIIY